jgi:cyclophilin family peptidyl-prolyl cis-trans isomerase
MAALRAIASRPDFDRVFGAGQRRVERELMIYFMNALRSDDAGLISEAAIALRAPDRNFNTLLADSTAQMKQILAELSLPAQLEPYLELDRTIRYLEGRAENPDLPVGFNHPIDWNRILIRIPQKATVRTSRGDISVELFPEEAPGSVVNFVNLAEMDFYDNLTFHRVVPNFVIQGGCPRGDGYGSLDYTIRSELGYLHYDKAGMLGMASAGNHTEGTQFFITHSPTPHLDGNYTLFGKVTSGMEVVHRIRQGDQILSIDIE